jgi:excisionase family DNA binding protein
MNTAYRIRGSAIRQDNPTPQVVTECSHKHILAGCPPLLTPAETAEVLRLSPGRVRGMLRDGRLRGVQVGTRWLVPKAWLERMLAGGTS